MSTQLSSRLGWLVAAAVVLLAWFSPFGDLNPPAGPVTATMKPLSQAEPRTPITAATTPGDADALFVISAPGSYYLTGNVTGVSGKHGIEITASSVTIDLCGFDLTGVAGSQSGIVHTGAVTTTLVLRNGKVRNWGATGILLTLTGNFLIEDVCAPFNAGNGIEVGNFGVLHHCVANGNIGTGLVPNTGVVVSGCSSSANGAGGIKATANCDIVDCSVDGNGTVGIGAGAGSLVRDCAVTFNLGNGIVAIVDCTIEGNVVDIAGPGSGILVLGSGNRIEHNNVTDADIGIDVDTAGNLVVGNSANGNTVNYSIVAGNTVGTIVATEAAMNAATNALVNVSY